MHPSSQQLQVEPRAVVFLLLVHCRIISIYVLSPDPEAQRPEVRYNDQDRTFVSMIWGHHLVVALGIGVASALLTTILWRNTTH